MPVVADVRACAGAHIRGVEFANIAEAHMRVCAYARYCIHARVRAGVDISVGVHSQLRPHVATCACIARCPHAHAQCGYTRMRICACSQGFCTHIRLQSSMLRLPSSMTHAEHRCALPQTHTHTRICSHMCMRTDALTRIDIQSRSRMHRRNDANAAAVARTACA
jgi:hypothetical protein